ncbi:PRDX1 protein, partial [Polyodon spathula]|nr:PRDX1 protein [Polyodon spathula]
MSAGNAQIGKPAPDFKATAVMPDGQFKEISLSDYRGKYVVFFFYPLDFTFVCPTEIIAFSDGAEDFKKINCEVIGASVDSHFCHLAWINTPRKQGGLGHMKIPLVADTRRSISQDYGVLKEDEGIAYRGLFIIDDKGILRQITINDLPVGRSVEETLRLVQAFQFTDKHGEVTPTDYQPPGFKEGERDSLWFEGTAVHIKVGELKSFHVMKVQVTVDQERVERMQRENALKEDPGSSEKKKGRRTRIQKQKQKKLH